MVMCGGINQLHHMNRDARTHGALDYFLQISMGIKVAKLALADCEI